jgi:hypothetical protein
MTGWHPADLILTPQHESALLEPVPGEPELGETFNVWLFDPDTNTGFNIHPRANGGTMMSSVTVFLPDGRIARANHGPSGRFSDPLRPASDHVALEVVEPFKHWRVTVSDVPVWLTSDAEQASGGIEPRESSTTIRLTADIFDAAEPWINGALLPESRQTMQEPVSLWMGNRTSKGFEPEAFRYDVLVRGQGVIRFEGRDCPMSGVGLRGHVRGVRRVAGMIAHCWSEGLSLDGKRGFGSTVFLRAGGGYAHSEAFLLQDGVRHPARIICTPQLERDPANPLSVYELACDELGLVRIEAEDLRQFWWRMESWGAPAPIRYGAQLDAPLLMKQGIARYRWPDGTLGYGLQERSG